MDAQEPKGTIAVSLITRVSLGAAKKGAFQLDVEHMQLGKGAEKFVLTCEAATSAECETWKAVLTRAIVPPELNAPAPSNVQQQSPTHSRVCERGSAPGGRACATRAANGLRYCDRHSCSAPQCKASKSSTSSACPQHTALPSQPQPLQQQPPMNQLLHHPSITTVAATFSVVVKKPLGMAFNTMHGVNGGLVVTKVKPGGGAEACGKISAGMFIESLNGALVGAVGTAVVGDMVRSSPGDSVTIVLRAASSVSSELVSLAKGPEVLPEPHTPIGLPPDPNLAARRIASSVGQPMPMPHGVASSMGFQTAGVATAAVDTARTAQAARRAETTADALHEALWVGNKPVDGALGAAAVVSLSLILGGISFGVLIISWAHVCRSELI